jgi:type IX secretion system PorP/SprF family membrane protein
MNKRNLQLIGVLILCLTAGILLRTNNLYAQQKVQYTQYMYDGSVINPAYVGVDEALSLTFINRNQWTNIKGAPKTQTLSAHTLFREKQIGVGLIVHNESIGVHSNFNLATNYAYHLPVGNKKYLSFGLQAGIHTRNSDYGSLLGGATDPGLNNVPISETYFDVGLGFYYRTPNLHIGYSIPEIIPNQISLDENYESGFKEVNHFLFTKYTIGISQSIDLQPGFLIKYIYGLPLSYDLNLIATFKEVISLGVSYRKQESIDFLFRVQVTPQLQFGYAYDHAIGNLSSIGTGSHELMGRYIFKFKYRNVDSLR